MTVKLILSSKSRDVATIEPTASLEAAITQLAQRRIGALVVLGPERRVVGILSERDIVRVLAEQGIMEQMTAGKFRHIPVIDHERLIGIISIGDVVKHRLGEMERESEALRDYIQTA